MVTTTGFDINTVRSRFPALALGQVYFDNAGGTQALDRVISSIQVYLFKTNVQLGGSYTASKQSTDRYKAAFQAAADFVNASVDDIGLGASATQLLRNLSFTLNFDPGDEIVVSSIDHEANIAPWVDMASRQKLVLKWWTPPKSTNPKLTTENLAPLLSERTRLVTLCHSSNILGSVHDVKAIAALVHDKCPRGLVCADGVAYAPHRAVDIPALGVDFYVFSWYKVFGPHISLIYGNQRGRSQMVPLGHYFNPQRTMQDKIGLAAASYELAQSIPAILDYLGRPGSAMWAGVMEHEFGLQSTLLRYLNSRPDVVVYGERDADPALRLSTVSFTVAGWDSESLVRTVEVTSPFGFRWGMFYSNRLVEQVLGLSQPGVVRVSFVHYNTVQEVEAFIKALDAALSNKIPKATIQDGRAGLS